MTNYWSIYINKIQSILQFSQNEDYIKRNLYSSFDLFIVHIIASKRSSYTYMYVATQIQLVLELNGYSFFFEISTTFLDFIQSETNLEKKNYPIRTNRYVSDREFYGDIYKLFYRIPGIFFKKKTSSTVQFFIFFFNYYSLFIFIFNTKF